jgi:hypothetical protein
MFLMNKTFVEKMDKHRRIFLGLVRRKKGNIIWLNGQEFVAPKNKGGLGVKDLRKQNISLLCKWWWKLDIQNVM